MAKRSKKPAKTSSKEKGRIVESIAAWLHDWPGVEVQKNARLPPLHGTGRRTVEIDVLLTTSVAGYPVRIAIECKNEAAPIETPYINSFIGKLDDVGIPHQQGIFISASRYTKDAVERAKDKGIRALMLSGLSPDGLKASITTAAYQSLVFLMARVSEVTWFTKEPVTLPHSPLFADARGRLCGTIPHLIAQKWSEGSIPTTAGVYNLTIPIPDGWIPFVSSGQEFELLPPVIHSQVKVTAFAFTVEGRAEEYSLVDFESSRVEKRGVRAFFDAPAGRRYDLTGFDTEADLEEFLASGQGFRITTRIKVPRIHHKPAYWPLSRHAAMRFLDLLPTARTADGSIRDVDTGEIEDLDIAAAFDLPITIQELDQLFLDAHRARAGKPGDPKA